jgi:cytochrome P450
MTSIFFYLSQNPDSYEKLIREIRSRFSSLSEIQTGPQLAQCHYLRACIDESMRMSPPISSTLWGEVRSGGIVIDGEYIPEGVDVGVSLYALHHNERISPDSYKFMPDCWIESDQNNKEVIERIRQSFSVFSIGTRACAGKTMAYTEISDTIARTLWSLDMKRAEGALGRLGGGVQYGWAGRNREGEFQLEDHITCCHDGPYLQFRLREE